MAGRIAASALLLPLVLLPCISLLNVTCGGTPTMKVSASAAGGTSKRVHVGRRQLRGRWAARRHHAISSEESNVLWPLHAYNDQPKASTHHVRELQANEEEDDMGTDIIGDGGNATNATDSETGSDGEEAGEESDPEETFVDKVKEGAASVKDEVASILNSNPSGWTSGQIAGIAIGGFLAVLIVFTCLACCCVKKCRRSKSTPGGSSTKGSSSTKGKQKYSMQRPYVTRSAGSAVDIKRNLPLGVRLHGALKLREAGLTGQGIRVAIIDSGIDKDHPGFNGVVKKQQWYRSGTPLSQDDHGTHVAGTVHLMAPDAELYDYRVFGDRGEIDGDNAIAQSIRQACSDGCHVINMSLRVSYPIVPAVRSAVKFASSRGVLMVCAAGNSGDGDPLTNELYSYPARWDETMSVAAVKKAGDLPVAFFSESNPQVDYAGIGVAVTSLKPGGGFQSMQGTSMAAPHVTGLIAALLSDKKEGGKTHSDEELRSQLNKYAIDIGIEGVDTSTGVGFVTFLSRDEFNQFWSAPEAQSLATAAFRARAY